MEQLVIQSNTNYSMALDSFVSAICNDNHIDNYYATFLVPLQNAVDRALSSSPSATLSFGYVQSGIVFAVDTDSTVFAQVEKSLDDLDDFSLMLSMLADRCEVRNDGRRLELTFAVSGIDIKEAHRRQVVMERFYVSSPTLVDVC